MLSLLWVDAHHIEVSAGQNNIKVPKLKPLRDKDGFVGNAVSGAFHKAMPARVCANELAVGGVGPEPL
ncbi:hypothetical protein HJFPF1_12179 [Paramyrothecium foliicola]|nr:hypothetical protein HJFPF1_12179 [Paramyrothecium foliicola]